MFTTHSSDRSRPFVHVRPRTATTALLEIAERGNTDSGLEDEGGENRAMRRKSSVRSFRPFGTANSLDMAANQQPADFEKLNHLMGLGLPTRPGHQQESSNSKRQDPIPSKRRPSKASISTAASSHSSESIHSFRSVIRRASISAKSVLGGASSVRSKGKERLHEPEAGLNASFGAQTLDENQAPTSRPHKFLKHSFPSRPFFAEEHPTRPSGSDWDNVTSPTDASRKTHKNESREGATSTMAVALAPLPPANSPDGVHFPALPVGKIPASIYTATPLTQGIPPLIPQGQGLAARMSAASHNQSLSTTAKPRTEELWADVTRPRIRYSHHSSSSADSALAMNSPEEYAHDSDVCLVHDNRFEPLLPTSHDPASKLPPELCHMVFTHLDFRSLCRAKQVSPQWHALVSSSRQHWRLSFLRKYHNPNPVPRPLLHMGGEGVGTQERAQNWEEMAKARLHMERNWLNGNGKAIYMSGHTDSVYCVQFDERKAITGSRDRTIRVWDLETYRCIKVIGGPAALPQPGQKKLAVNSANTLLDVDSMNGTPEGNAIFHAPDYYHSASILCLQYDEDIMVTGSSDNSCIVWDMHTYQPIRRLTGHVAGVLDVCFDSKYIISCSKDVTINIWSRKDGTLLRTLTGHRGPVNAVQLRNNRLVSASGDGIAKLWNVDTGACVREFTSQDRGLAAVEFSDDGRFVLAGGNDQVIYKFDAQTGELLEQFKGHTALVRSLFLDAKNNRVISGSYDLSLRVYDFEKGMRGKTIEFPGWTTSWMLSAKSDYRKIVSTSQDGRLMLIDFAYDVPNADLLKGI